MPDVFAAPFAAPTTPKSAVLFAIITSGEQQAIGLAVALGMVAVVLWGCRTVVRWLDGGDQ